MWVIGFVLFALIGLLGEWWREWWQHRVERAEAQAARDVAEQSPDGLIHEEGW